MAVWKLSLPFRGEVRHDGHFGANTSTDTASRTIYSIFKRQIMAASTLYAERCLANQTALGTDRLHEWTDELAHGIGVRKNDRGEMAPLSSVIELDVESQIHDAAGRVAWAPIDPVSLLARHRLALQRLLLASADRALFESHFLPLLIARAAYVQDLPDLRDPAFARAGGLFELGLRTALSALRRLDSRVFGLTLDPIQRRRHRERWKLLVFFAALGNDGGRLTDLTVTCDDRPWRRDETLFEFASEKADAGTDRNQADSAARHFVVRRAVTKGVSTPRERIAWLPRRTQRFLEEDPFFARLLDIWLEEGPFDTDDAKFLLRLVNDALFETLAGAPVPQGAAPNASVRAALGTWVENAWLEAVREGLWLFAGPECDGPLLYGYEGVFLLWPEGPSKILTEGFAAFPGVPRAAEGLPEDLNDWLRLLQEAGVVETRGDGSPLFLLSVPPMGKRRHAELAEKLTGRLEEAVLLRGGERYLEAARMRAARENLRFWGEPLGSLLHETRHSEEKEAICEAARDVLPGRFVWVLNESAIEPPALRETLESALVEMNRGDPVRLATPYGVFFPLRLIERPSLRLVMRWLTEGGWLLQNRPGLLFWRREEKDVREVKQSGKERAVRATTYELPKSDGSPVDTFSEEGVVVAARALRPVLRYPDGREKDVPWPSAGRGFCARGELPVTAACWK